jgi:hypothetical protein
VVPVEVAVVVKLEVAEAEIVVVAVVDWVEVPVLVNELVAVVDTVDVCEAEAVVLALVVPDVVAEELALLVNVDVAVVTSQPKMVPTTSSSANSFISATNPLHSAGFTTNNPSESQVSKLPAVSKRNARLTVEVNFAQCAAPAVEIPYHDDEPFLQDNRFELGTDEQVEKKAFRTATDRKHARSVGADMYETVSEEVVHPNRVLTTVVTVEVALVVNDEVCVDVTDELRVLVSVEEAVVVADVVPVVLPVEDTEPVTELVAVEVTVEVSLEVAVLVRVLV